MARFSLSALTFLGGAAVPALADIRGPSLEAFYGALGIAPMGTEMQGDCAFETICAM